MIVVFVTKPEVDFLVRISSIILTHPASAEQPFSYDLTRINTLASRLQERWEADIPHTPLLLSRRRWQIVLELLTETAGAMRAKDVIEGEHVPGIDYQAFYVKIREAIARQKELSQ